jgi:D-amino-acid dehydrogenase
VQEPALAPVSHKFVGGLKLPGDETGDARLFTERLAKQAEAAGVVFRMGAAITAIQADGSRIVSLETSQGSISADAYVMALGSYSPRMLRPLGIRLHVYPVKGYSITVPLETTVSQNAAPTVSLLDDATKIVTSRLGRDRFRVAGTAEFNGENRDIRADRIKPLVNWVHDLFPQVETARAVPWAGLRPMTPNLMPRIGSGSRPGVFYNTGHGHLGWTLSAATAQMVAEAVHSHTMSNKLAA